MHASRASRNGVPSFFQSLLSEVENVSTAINEPTSRAKPSNHYAASSPVQNCFPSISTALSPSSSNLSSPRARSLSPGSAATSRPSSPPLTSRIEPVFAQQPLAQRPRKRSEPQDQPHDEDSDFTRYEISYNDFTPSAYRKCSASGPPDKNEAQATGEPTPTGRRASMSLSAKQDIQR